MNGGGERSIATVLTDIVGNVQQIVQKEIRLAKVELREEATKARRGVALLAVGAGAAVLASGFMLLAAVHGLSLVVAPWLAAVIVGVATAGFGAAMIARGLTQLKQVSIPPPATMAAIEENLQWTKTGTK